MCCENSIWSVSPKPEFLSRRELELEDLSLLKSLIDWNYFFLAWNVQGNSPFAEQLKEDAIKELEILISEKIVLAKAVIDFYPVKRCGDSLEVLEKENFSNCIEKLHFLRMQEVLGENAFLSLADFFSPTSVDWIGLFALSASLNLEKSLVSLNNDPYRILLQKTLVARLTEAYSEFVHREVMKKWWGYAKEKSFGIRPVPGYPTTPDHSEIETLWRLLKPESIGMNITSSRMMIPEASVCGYYVAHPKARYFNIRHIGKDQLFDYANRKGLSPDNVEKELNRLL